MRNSRTLLNSIFVLLINFQMAAARSVCVLNVSNNVYLCCLQIHTVFTTYINLSIGNLAVPRLAILANIILCTVAESRANNDKL